MWFKQSYCYSEKAYFIHFMYIFTYMYMSTLVRVHFFAYIGVSLAVAFGK